MRVLVCGSRDFTQDEFRIVDCMLTGLCSEHENDPQVVIIDGGAKGADSYAHDWASRNYLNHLNNLTSHGTAVKSACFPAQWKKHGKAAGPIRNQQMIDEGKPDIVIAFINKDLEDSVGTRDMVERAMTHNIPTYVVQHKE